MEPDDYKRELKELARFALDVCELYDNVHVHQLRHHFSALADRLEVVRVLALAALLPDPAPAAEGGAA